MHAGKWILITVFLTLFLAACGPAATATPLPPTAAAVSPTTVPVPPPSEPSPMTAERLVDECARAMGGIEKIAALETMRSTQRFPDHGRRIRYEISRPNRVRMGDELVFDGQRAAWLTGEPVPQEEWQDFEVDIAWYIPAFFDYPAEYLGTEVVNGIETHVLQVPLPLGATMTYNLDAQTCLVYRASAHITIGDKEFDPERIYGDYRWQDGILYPHAFTYEGRTGVFTATIETLEFNVPLEDERFAVPTTPGPDANGSAAAGALPITPDTAGQVELLSTLRGHGDKVFTLGFSGDGTYLASHSGDREIKVWDVRNGQLAHTIGQLGAVGNGIAFSPVGTLLATADTAWDIQGMQVVQTPGQGEGAVAFSDDGSLLAIAPAGRPIMLWDVANWQVIRTFDDPAENLFRCLAFSPDGTLLAAGSNNNTIRLWDVASGDLGLTIQHDTGGDVREHILDLAFSPDGRLLASSGTDLMVRLWDVASWQVTHKLRIGEAPMGLAFSPDGAILASSGPSLQLWDVESGKLLRTLPHSEVITVAFSPDGTLLASGGYDNQVYLWGVTR